VKGKTLRPLVRAHVAKGGKLHTDELLAIPEKRGNLDLMSWFESPV